MDLKNASEQDMRDEIARREMIKKNGRIKEYINAITIAYNSGKISDIYKDDDKSTKYTVYLK
jgi:hypothetical protein